MCLFLKLLDPVTLNVEIQSRICVHFHSGDGPGNNFESYENKPQNAQLTPVKSKIE